MNIKDFKTKTAEELSEQLQHEIKERFDERIKFTRELSFSELKIKKPKIRFENGTI